MDDRVARVRDLPLAERVRQLANPVGCVYRKSDSAILVMKSAKDRL
jgi:hypothetical protein